MAFIKHVTIVTSKNKKIVSITSHCRQPSSSSSDGQESVQLSLKAEHPGAQTIDLQP
jgi:hypothetical protein